MTVKMKPIENIVGKEKMLESSIFSFSHSVFYPSKKEFLFFTLHLFCHLELLSV